MVQYKRLGSITDPLWVDALVYMIQHGMRKEPARAGFFRWHDSGDIQDLFHLVRIVEIAERLPDVRFWLPTREKALILCYLREFGQFPANLTVRLSAAMIDAEAPQHDGLVSSAVVATVAPYGHECPAPRQGNYCGECRACWSPLVPVVSYHAH